MACGMKPVTPAKLKDILDSILYFFFIGIMTQTSITVSKKHSKYVLFNIVLIKIKLVLLLLLQFSFMEKKARSTHVHLNVLASRIKIAIAGVHSSKWPNRYVVGDMQRLQRYIAA